LEYQVLKAMEDIPIPTPKVYGLDAEGENFGEPCFFMELIEGESLLTHLLAGESWAGDLYIATADQLHSVSLEDLGGVADLLEAESIEDVLDSAYAYLHNLDDPVAEQAYQRLKQSVPKSPKLCFSNGDLYPDNMLVKNKTLVGVIDFANASVSDPLFEFLLTFFCHPELRGRGIEERFCEIKGINPDVLSWYHGLEFFDTWRWVSKYGEPFVGYDETKLRAALEGWLGVD
jgi:aminoglycoside phosphotransferase (APT) family kinase protein